MRHTLFSIIFLATLTQGMAFSIIDQVPTSQGVSALPSEEIQLYVDGMIDITSLSANTVMVFGRWSGPAELTFEVGGFGNLLIINHAEDFFAGEYVMVQLSDQVAALNGDLLEGGYSYGYWVRTLPGSMDLIDVGHLEVRQPGEEFIQSYGAYAGDLDGDGWGDLTVVNETAEDMRIFMSNEGSFTDFIIHDLPLGNKPSANEGTDFNGDGEIDLVIGNTQGDMVSVVMGIGGGLFGEETIYTASQGVRGVTILDIEGDGDMDIATANRVGSNIMLFLNDGTGNFSAGETIGAPLSGETAITSADMNEDRRMDLIVGGYLSDDIAIYLNDGGGGFDLESVTSTGDAPWMITMGDVNGDGHVDIGAASSGSNSISIHLGDGLGGLSAVDSYPTNGFPLAIDLGDLDGDGDLDVISSNYSGGTYSLYENLGSGLFGNLRTLQAEIAGSCAIFHDRNNDGVMDITGIDELADVLIFFENAPNALESLSIDPVILYPNPSSGNFVIEFEALDEAQTLILCDLQGRVLDEKQVAAGATQLSWRGPTVAGEYFLLNKADQRRVTTFIIE